MRKIIYVIAVLMCANAAAVGQDQKKKEESITRAYDVRDFIMQVRDFPFQGEMGVPTESSAVVSKLDLDDKTTKPIPASPKRTRQQLIDELTTLVKETIDPDSWRDAGG